MKLNRLLFLIIISLFVFTSCNFVIKTIYGIRKPKIETEQSLKKYLNKKHINADNIYAVSSNDLETIVKQIKGFPEILIFDKKGRNIKYKEEGQCNAYAFSFVEELSDEMSFEYNDSLKLDDYIAMLKDFNGNAVKINKSEDIDFYLFIFWARYSGRLNKNHVKVWEEQSENNKKSEIDVIKVSLDIQEWWTDTIKTN